MPSATASLDRRSRAALEPNEAEAPPGVSCRSASADPPPWRPNPAARLDPNRPFRAAWHPEEPPPDLTPAEAKTGTEAPWETPASGPQPAAGESASQNGTSATADETCLRLEQMPKEVGVMLISVGVLGVVLPAVAGGPALVAGGLVLWPKAFGRVERWLERRFPNVHKGSMKQLSRYLDDLDRRYPSAFHDTDSEAPNRPS